MQVTLTTRYNSPFIVQRADPYLYLWEGKYYFTATCPEYDRIEIRCSETVNGIAEAPARVIWRKHALGPLACHVWAPEIHFIMGKWVIYFAAGNKPGKWKIRPYALVCKGNDPMADEWELVGKMQAADGDPYPFTDFSLDMTVFEHRGKWYTIWAQKFGTEESDPPISNLYIAELLTPFKLKSFHVLLSTPDYDWERRGGFWVNEGPAILKHDGKIFCTYSASATGACYCMGMLTAEEDADLLDPRSWQKEREPVFKTDETLKIYGPGHNCFVQGEEGEQLTVLHFRDYETIHGDPLDDHNRHAHVLRVRFSEEGKPLFEADPSLLYNVPYENEKQKKINS